MPSPSAQRSEATAGPPLPAVAASAASTRRRVVFVTRRYGGEVGATSVRLQAYTRAVRQLGFEVSVLTRFPFPEARLAANRDDRRRWMQVDTIDDCPVRRLRMPAEERLERGLDRLLRRIARATGTPRILGMEAIDFLFACAALPWLLARRPDAIVVEQGPVWLALPLRVCTRAGSALVLQISDIKSTAMASGQYGLVPADRVALNASLEARAWRAATRVVTVTGRMRDIIVSRGRVPGHAVELIPNGVEIDRVRPAPAAERERSKRALGLDGRFVALYAGALGAAHDVETLVRAAALLREDPRGRDISVLIVGEGPRRSPLSRLITDLGIATVHLHRGVPPEALDPFLAAADLGVSTERRGPSTTLRAKLFLYMGAGLPVLATDDGGEVRALMRRAGAGLLADAEDPAALAAAIIRLRHDPDLAGRCADSGRRYAEAHHDRRLLARRFARVVAAAATARA